MGRLVLENVCLVRVIHPTATPQSSTALIRKVGTRRALSRRATDMVYPSHGVPLAAPGEEVLEGWLQPSMHVLCWITSATVLAVQPKVLAPQAKITAPQVKALVRQVKAPALQAKAFATAGKSQPSRFQSSPQETKMKPGLSQSSAAETPGYD